MVRSPREVVDQVRRMVAGEGVIFADLFAEDGVLEYPFALPGQPRELCGREAIRTYLGAAPRPGQLFDMDGVDALVRETDDPEAGRARPWTPRSSGRGGCRRARRRAGPPTPLPYSRRFGGYSRMISQHIGKHLREDQRARWVALLARSADEAGLPTDPEFRAAFTAYLEWGSRIAVENSGDGAQPPRGMPVPRWWWVCNATPAARPSAQPAAAPDPTPGFETPAPDDAVSFERHIRGLFRSRDRGSMRFVFDLWSVDDVREHADAILARLRNGSMPCDGAWPAEKIDVFVRWVESGTSA